ncbi:hypothetical protein DLE01_01425, partial [Streptomyces sp. FT05W]
SVNRSGPGRMLLGLLALTLVCVPFYGAWRWNEFRGAVTAQEETRLPGGRHPRVRIPAERRRIRFPAAARVPAARLVRPRAVRTGGVTAGTAPGTGGGSPPGAAAGSPRPAPAGSCA